MDESLDRDPDHEGPTISMPSASNAVGGGPPSQRYLVEEEIARGGMGVIYRVRDDALHRNLAMKVLLGFDAKDGNPSDSEWANRFLEEAQVTAQLAHPGVVPVHELGIDAAGRVFFTMSLVRGKTLSDVVALARKGADGWSMTRALQVILRVCETLAFAHSKGVIHRDIKPDNVMVGRFGETYLMDWGLAKVLGGRDLHDIRLRQGAEAPSIIESKRDEDVDGDHTSPIVTMDGAVVGTPAYMPPEQARGQADLVDMRSDVYAVGALLYELLTGQPPYVPPGAKMSPRTVLVAVHTGPPTSVRKVAPRAPEELVAICEKAMARERSERYATAVELAEDVQSFLSGHVVRAHRTGALVEMRKWVARNRLAAAALLAVACTVVVGLVVSLQLLDRSQTSEREARRAVYSATLGLVVADLDRGSTEAAIDGLESIDPEQRRWEWEVLNARTDRTVRRIRGSGPKFDAAGRLWVARPQEGGGAVVQTWDLTTSECVEGATLTGDQKAWMFPDAGYALSHGSGEAILQRLPSGAEILRTPAAEALGLVGRSGALLVALESDHKWLHLVDTTTGDVSSRRRTDGLAVSHSRDLLAVWLGDPGRVELLDADSLETLRTIPGIAGRPALAFTPDDSELLVGEEQWRRFDAGTGAPSDWFVRVRPADAGADEAEFAPDGSRFAYATDKWSVQVVDAGKRGELLAAWYGHEAPLRSIVFSPDGGHMASDDEAGWTLVWSGKSNRRADSLTQHTCYAYGASFSPDGSLLASGGWDGYISNPGCQRVSDVATGEQVAAWGVPGERALWVEFFPDGKRLLTLVADDLQGGGTLHVWDARTGEHLERLSDVSVDGADIHPTVERVAAINVERARTEGTGRLIIFDVATGAARRSAEQDLRRDVSPQFIAGGALVAAPTSDRQVRIWDADTLEPRTVLRGAEGVVWRVAESPDGRLLAGAATSDEAIKDAAVLIWEISTGRLIARLPGHGSGALAVAFSPDGTRIVTGGRDGAVHIWDAVTYKKIVSLTGHQGYVYHVAFDPTGERLVSVGMDGDVRIWETTPFSERHARRMERDRILARVGPGIGAQLDAGDRPADIAARVEARTDLTPRERGIALQVLLSEGVRRRDGDK